MIPAPPSAVVRGEADPEDHGPPLDHPYLSAGTPGDNPLRVLHHAASIEDPVARAQALTEQLGVLMEWVSWGSEQRNVAVLQMRQKGVTYEAIAEALNISKARAAQLCRRLKDKYPGGLPPSWRRQAHDPSGSSRGGGGGI